MLNFTWMLCNVHWWLLRCDSFNCRGLPSHIGCTHLTCWDGWVDLGIRWWVWNLFIAWICKKHPKNQQLSTLYLNLKNLLNMMKRSFNTRVVFQLKLYNKFHFSLNVNCSQYLMCEKTTEGYFFESFISMFLHSNCCQSILFSLN